METSSRHSSRCGSCVYGYRKIHKDLREFGETCGLNRIARLMKQEGLKTQVGQYIYPRSWTKELKFA